MGKIFTDQLGRSVVVKSPARKIVSLVPSLTELLFSLGLKENISAVTRFCVHPKEECEAVPKIGGTKDFDVEKILALQPDLIIASKEENTRAGIESLSERCPVWISDIKNLEEALAAIQMIGAMTGTEQPAREMAEEIRSRFQKLLFTQSLSVAYIIWRKPYMSIGRDTFIHDMLSRMGFKNVFEHEERYPVFTREKLQSLAPDLVFLSSEPYPFKEKHLEEFMQMVPDARTILVDGEYFSWYGSRLLNSPDYFNKLIREISNLEFGNR